MIMVRMIVQSLGANPVTAAGGHGSGYRAATPNARNQRRESTGSGDVSELPAVADCRRPPRIRIFVG
jgi:hypothetical protein